MFYTSGVHFDPELHEISYKVYQWFTANCYSLSEVEVEVHYCDLTEDNVFGWCEQVDDNSWLIHIHNALGYMEHFKTLFHEFQHVIQDIYGIKCDVVRETEAYQIEGTMYNEMCDSRQTVPTS